MKIKVIVLLLVLGAVLFSGCVGNQQPTPEKNETPTGTVTPIVTATPAETATPEVNATSVETTTPEVNNTSEVNVTSTTGTSSKAYLIRLDNYRASASSLDLKKGETISWMNMQDNPKRKFTLVSQEGLFENKTLVYRQPFAYTFNETGNYNFYIVGQPRMNVSVSVAAT
jgi:PBP1b-binding outer membrane lipoprotein LpoB